MYKRHWSFNYRFVCSGLLHCLAGQFKPAARSLASWLDEDVMGNRGLEVTFDASGQLLGIYLIVGRDVLFDRRQWRAPVLLQVLDGGFHHDRYSELVAVECRGGWGGCTASGVCHDLYLPGTKTFPSRYRTLLKRLYNTTNRVSCGILQPNTLTSQDRILRSSRFSMCSK